MAQINFAECSGNKIFEYLWIIYETNAKAEFFKQKYEKFKERSEVLERRISELEKKSPRSDTTELKIKLIKAELSGVFNEEFFAEDDLKKYNLLLDALLERYKGLIDEKYIFDGTLSEVIDVFLNGDVETVEQALKILKKI